VSSVLRPHQQVIRETVFTGQKTQPIVSKYWRRIYKKKQHKKHKEKRKYTHTK